MRKCFDSHDHLPSSVNITLSNRFHFGRDLEFHRESNGLACCLAGRASGELTAYMMGSITWSCIPNIDDAIDGHALPRVFERTGPLKGCFAAATVHRGTTFVIRARKPHRAMQSPWQPPQARGTVNALVEDANRQPELHTSKCIRLAVAH